MARKTRHALSVWLFTATMCLAFLSACPQDEDEPEAGQTRAFAGIEFQWCPPGTFTMGSPEDEQGHIEDEIQHQVTISEGFWLGRFEVTQTQWQALMGSNPSHFNIDTRNPVDSISWDDVQEFIAALNEENPDMTFRLPTESEWEYACRAGTETRYYFGEDPTMAELSDNVWHNDNSDDETHPVGGKSPNAWGLHDMIGNVSEWCRDWYGDYPVEAVADPVGPPLGDFRVVRGGWICILTSYRSAERRFAPPDESGRCVGFRLVREP